jgi:hypothetical protein
VLRMRYSVKKDRTTEYAKEYFPHMLSPATSVPRC